MISQLILLGTLLSPTQSALSGLYDALVAPDADAEFVLAKGEARVAGEPQHLVSGILGREAVLIVDSDVTLENLVVKELGADGRVDAIVAALFKDSDYVPYFCHRFAGLEDEWEKSDECIARVRQLFAPLAEDLSSQVVVVDVEGDYYGANRWVTIYVGRSEVRPIGEYLTFKLDLIHEI